MLGKKLGRFQILERLGSGGMGEVYRAHDTHLDRDVALKVLSASTVTDQGSRRRFYREATTLAQLKHPHIGTVYDFGAEGGVDFLVMELVEGTDLGTFLQTSGPLPETDVVRLGIQISQALEEAHEHKIVHRDLKPQNVMITPRGEAKVLDFGLAKLVQASDEAPTMSITEVDGVMGTLPYMAPEQLRGGTVDGRTDVYALGVTLYEMATGQRPFQSQNRVQLMTAILQSPPTNPRILREDLSKGLERVLLNALEKDERKRYQTAGALREDLERLQSGIPVEAPAVRPRWFRSVAMVLSFLALAATILLVFNVMGLRKRLLETPSNLKIASLAVLPLNNLSGDSDQEYFAEGIHEELITDLMKVRGVKVIARASVMRYSKSQIPLQTIAEELGVDALVTGAVLCADDRVRITAQLIEGRTEQSLWAESYVRDLRDVLSLQNDVVSDIVRQIQVSLSPSEAAQLTSTHQVDPRAYEALLRGRYFLNRFTEEGIRRSIEYFQAAIALDSTYAEAYLDLAYSYEMVAIGHDVSLSQQDACQRAKKAIDTAHMFSEPDSWSHLLLARYYEWCAGEWQLFRQEIETAFQLNPNSSPVCITYALLLLTQGRTEEAIEQARKAVELDPVTPLTLADLGYTLLVARHYDESVEALEKCLDLDPRFPPALGVLANTYGAQGKFKEAVASAKAAATESNWNTQWLANLGWAYGVAGMQDSAQAVLQELHQRTAKEIVQSIYFAWVYLGMGDTQLALDWLEKAADEQSDELFVLSVEPTYDNLRDDPRFHALLERVGLSQSPSMR